MAGYDINKINELVGEKEFEAAQEAIKEALLQGATDLELIKLAGLVSVNLDLWNDSKKHFETVVKFEPQDATSWYYLASSYEKLGDYISAKNAYLKVIELREEYIEAYKSLCVVLMKTNDIELAIKIANQAKKIDSETSLFDFVIGTAYMKDKEFSKAIIALEDALKFPDKHLGILNSLGTCYMATGNTSKAIETYEEALSRNPQNPMAYFNIGSAYQIQQNHEKAIEYLKKAVDLEEDEHFISTLAMSETKLERFEDALYHYKQLSLINPSNEKYKYNIVTCYEALGEFDTAINILEGMIYLNPKFTLPAQKLASLYLKTNQLVKAKEIYDNILLKNNVTPEIMYQYAILSSSLCDTATAERMLKKVIKMNPNLAKAHKDLGIIYLNKRLFDYAEEEFKLAMELKPNDFEIIFEYGNFLYSISKNQEAEQYYLEALELAPNNVLALTFMALNKLVLNKLDEAKEYIYKAVNQESEHEYVLFCTGRILYACKEYEEAKRYLVKAVEKNPDIETQNTLALTYFELGEYESALNIFKNIDSKAPKSVSVLMSIAKCYEALNNNDEALHYLDRVVEIFPDNEDAHEMIRKLS